MAKKYKTKIEITAPAVDKNEAMEIVGDYLSGNIVSGIDMKCTTKQVRFYDNCVARTAAIVLLVGLGFLFTAKTVPQARLTVSNCQTAAVQPPLRTAGVIKNEAVFKKAWEEKQTHEALNIIIKK